jgi:hypothetical protein
MGIVRDPLCSLACITRTEEGICDGVAFAQIGVVRTGWPSVMVSRPWQRIDSKRCERDETTKARRCEDKQRRQLTASVACRHQERCDRASILAERVKCLNTMTTQSDNDQRMHDGDRIVPIPTTCCSPEQQSRRLQSQRRRRKMQVVQRGVTFRVRRPCERWKY